MFSDGYNLMGCIKEIPTLKGDNYTEWKKKIDLAFILAEVDWVVTSPCPTEPVAPVRETNEADAVWATRERDFKSEKMSYDLEYRKWVTTNNKCLAVIKNTIEPTIMGSIPECDTVTEYLEKKRVRKNKESVHWLFKDICYPADKAAGDRDVLR